MTLFADATCATVPTDALGAGVGWLQAFDPSTASLPELDHATTVLGQVRGFVEAVEVRVGAARTRLLEAAAPRPTGSRPSPRPRPAPPRPGGITAAEAKRRRDAELGGTRLPGLVAVVEARTVSLDHLVAVGRVRNAEPLAAHAAEIEAAAVARSADEFAAWLREWDAACDRARGIDLDEQRRQRRSLSFFDAELGTGGTRVILAPRQHAELRDAVFHMTDELWRGGADRSATPAQRMADALVELVARGAAVRRVAPTDVPATTGGGAADRAADDDAAEERAADDVADGDPGAATAGSTRTDGPNDAGGFALRRPGRTTMVVLIDERDLFGRLEGAGYATTVDGVRITATEARMLACQAELLPVVLGGAGEVLDLGRSRRYASDAQWRALLVRDHGCVVLGCPAAAVWCDAHHGIPWPAHGPTDLGNLWLYCGGHHLQHHREGWQGRVEGGHVHLTDAHGTVIPTKPATPPGAGRRALAPPPPAPAPPTRSAQPP